MAIRISTFIFLAGIALQPCAHAQTKADRKVIKQLQADIGYLASDELEGRRTSTEGERKAADYIEKRYREAGILPYNGQYRYPFYFIYGKQVGPSTSIAVNGAALRISEDVFPLPFSANAQAKSEVLPEIMEQGSVWMMPLYTDADQADNPHFEPEKYMFEKAREVEKQGASGVVFFDSYGSKYEPSFNKQSQYEVVGIPAVFMNVRAYQKYITRNEAESSQKEGVAIDMNVEVKKADRTGTNIAAYIDNKAKYTVIVGAHYDHLGYGEDENSLHANAVKEHLIHHGADDNASGTAALLEVAKWVKQKKLRHYNYLFINFSGEELGLFGSKMFVKEQQIDSSRVAYMINMDMLGRLNDSTRALTVGGIGTSPAWASISDITGKEFKLVIDSSGQGPSDHTSFYNAGIPVLFFFTGTHKDYHKPSDRAEAINYTGETRVIKCVHKVIAKMDKEHVKPLFTPTKQQTMGKTRFRVTLGIMPDYTYQDGGVRVDGVSDNRPAMKAGVKQGDIILQLGDNKITGMQTYMEALGKFSPGEKTNITVKRDGKEMQLPIELSK
ncbi:MAG: M20/M25/M40 family metallo-hydrolase [Bacteroidota bacterium]